jgi:hypothetical protein
MGLADRDVAAGPAASSSRSISQNASLRMDYSVIAMRALAAAASLLAIPAPANAYIGPGSGLGAVGVTLAILVGVFLLLAGFVWYPLKRMIKSRKAQREASPPSRDP